MPGPPSPPPSARPRPGKRPRHPSQRCHPPRLRPGGVACPRGGLDRSPPGNARKQERREALSLPRVTVRSVGLFILFFQMSPRVLSLPTDGPKPSPKALADLLRVSWSPGYSQGGPGASSAASQGSLLEMPFSGSALICWIGKPGQGAQPPPLQPLQVTGFTRSREARGLAVGFPRAGLFSLFCAPPGEAPVPMLSSTEQVLVHTLQITSNACGGGGRDKVTGLD